MRSYKASPISFILFVYIFLGSSTALARVYDSTQFFVFKDTSAVLPFEKIKSADFQHHFIPLDNSNLRYDLTKSAIWIRVNSSTAKELYRYIELSSPNLHHIEYYLPTVEGGYRKIATGFLSEFSTRHIEIDHFIFPVSFKGNYFLRITSDHFLNTNIRVTQLNKIMSGVFNRNLLYALYAGLILIMITVVAVYIFHGKEYFYFFYIGYAFFISAVIFVEKSFYFQFFWPNRPDLNLIFPALPFGVSFCLILFLKFTFKIDTLTPIIYKINLWITIILFIPIIPLLLINQYQFALICAQLSAIIFCSLVFVMSAIAYIKSREYRPFMRLIVSGSCLFCLGVIVYLCAQNELLSLNFYTENAVTFGSLFEVCFFGASISLYQTSLTKKYHLLVIQQNEDLQKGILERTFDLNIKNEQLINSIEERNNLLNIVVHDLKSPLNQTKALASLIAREVVGQPQVQELLDLFKRANDHGLKLIEDLNSIGQLEENLEVVIWEEVNIYSELCLITRNFEGIIDVKRIAIQISGDLTCMVKTHKISFVRIIDNLISNALKFSKFGSTILIVVKKIDSCMISITDQGPGFSEEDKRKLYHKFQRLSAIPTNGEHSTGLGLYIIKLLADRIGVTVSLQTEVGRGSTFTLKF